MALLTTGRGGKYRRLRFRSSIRRYDLISLRAYISEDDPVAAKCIALLILHSAEHLLTQNQKIGCRARVPDTRELVISKTPVIVPYRIQSDVLQILGVYHHSRRWPERL